MRARITLHTRRDMVSDRIGWFGNVVTHTIEADSSVTVTAAQELVETVEKDLSDALAKHHNAVLKNGE
ncbi:MAG: hypothetical protein Q4B96_05135 [Bacillota bacterium]|nr:hypothetical protein [Bacillota bacterium]